MVFDSLIAKPTLAGVRRWGDPEDPFRSHPNKRTFYFVLTGYGGRLSFTGGFFFNSSITTWIARSS
jgi:hypothetical protein